MSLEEQFYRRVDEMLYRLLEMNPGAATQLGEHRWDDRLAERSAEALAEEHRLIQGMVAELRAVDAGSLSLNAQIDVKLANSLFGTFLRDYEQVEGHLRNPFVYLDEALGGVVTLIMVEFAPLADRLRSALGRVREVPRVLAQGQANLVPERVPPVWAEVALEQAESAGGLFLGLLPAMAAEAAPELQEDLAQTGQAAAEAVAQYAAFLRDVVLPVAAGDFAAGRQAFDEKLREEHMVDYDADALLATGWEQFKQTRALMEGMASEIDPGRTAKEILAEARGDHPIAEGLLDAYRQEMAAIRQYVIDHDIATIPEGEVLRIIETPDYLQPIVPFAAYSPPGMLEERQEGLFLVTPVDPSLPPEVQEEKLRGHSWSKLPLTALHEAYPGHHLQLVWANRQPRIARRLGSFLATLFIEGWAFYCEELLEQMGYIARPIQRLGRLSDQLWRAGRIILDVSLHTQGMPVQEAVDFLVDECGLERAAAEAEVRRYTMTPTQPQSYLMGKLAIMELVADYRRANPGASLRQVHDAILGCGSLPPRLIRQQLAL
jgi:uncharacterized protein (DUF885 family)